MAPAGRVAGPTTKRPGPPWRRSWSLVRTYAECGVIV